MTSSVSKLAHLPAGSCALVSIEHARYLRAFPRLRRVLRHRRIRALKAARGDRTRELSEATWLKARVVQ